MIPDDPEYSDGEAYQVGMARTKDLIDHVFGARLRIEDNLKITNISAGVLLGFRETFLADLKGTAFIGTATAARGMRKQHAGEGKKWKSTKKITDI
jgi:hypothetical protein